jgi:hypothetical protein
LGLQNCRVGAIAPVNRVRGFFSASDPGYIRRSTEVWLKEKDGWKIISSQTLALPEDPPEIRLPVRELEEYVGTYSAGPDYVIKIERAGESLVSATNGGKGSPLLVEVRDVLFTPGQPRLRRVFERDAGGKVVGFYSRREGHDLHFKREA